FDLDLLDVVRKVVLRSAGEEDGALLPLLISKNLFQEIIYYKKKHILPKLIERIVKGRMIEPMDMYQKHIHPKPTNRVHARATLMNRMDIHQNPPICKFPKLYG